MAKLAPPPIAVRVTHAAQLLDCSRQHVYQLIERGELRRLRISGSTAVRIPIVDIYAVLGMEVPDEAA
jgi:excisionase family DNA binding protein